METDPFRPKSAKGRIRSRLKSSHPRGRVQIPADQENNTSSSQDNNNFPVRPKSAHPRSRSRISLRSEGVDVISSSNKPPQKSEKVKQTKPVKQQNKAEVETKLLKRRQNSSRKMDSVPQHSESVNQSEMNRGKRKSEIPVRNTKPREVQVVQPLNPTLRPKTPALLNVDMEVSKSSQHPPIKSILKSSTNQPTKTTGKLPVPPTPPLSDYPPLKPPVDNSGRLIQKHNDVEYQTAPQKSTIYSHGNGKLEVKQSFHSNNTQPQKMEMIKVGNDSEEDVKIPKQISPYIDEMEYYANLDPVEYFADTSIRDLPIISLPKSPETPRIENPSKPLAKVKPKVKSRPWSEGMSEKEKLMFTRKKYINTKNSIYAMFFENNGYDQDFKIDYSRYVAMPDDVPFEDDIAKGNSNKMDIHATGRNELKPSEMDLSKTTLVNNAINFQHNNKWTTPPKHPSPIVKNNLQNSYIKNNFKSMIPVHLHRKVDRRPFSDGRPPVDMTDKELLRFTTNANLYARTNERMIAKYKKTSHAERPTNLPTGIDKKPRIKGALIPTDNLKFRHNREMAGRDGTPHGHTRKLKPVHITYKN